MIGLGALKFFLLKVDPKKRMLFNPEESIQLQGHTGPFIQYTHARIRSLLRKSEKLQVPAKAQAITALEKSEREVIRLLAQYPVRLEEAAREYSPAVVANFAFDLAKEYNQFYQTVPILTETDPGKLRFRLDFSHKVAEVLKHAMSLLGIAVPDRM
jgi:arginyl-tRNA synthetase